jgi:hypothetical protein
MNGKLAASSGAPSFGLGGISGSVFGEEWW